MTVYAITDTKKGRTGIAPTYLQTTQDPQKHDWPASCWLAVYAVQLGQLRRRVLKCSEPPTIVGNGRRQSSCQSVGGGFYSDATQLDVELSWVALL